MKFRYVLKNKHTNQIHYKWYTLSQIEHGGLGMLFDIENYDIIERNRFVGLQDKHKIDIYSGDKIQFYTREMIKRSGIVKFKSCSFYIDDEDGASYFAWMDYSMIEIIK